MTALKKLSLKSLNYFLLKNTFYLKNSQKHLTYEPLIFSTFIL